jgi:HK97 gp10 family phage protein
MKPEELAAKLTPEKLIEMREQLMSDILNVALANSQKRTPVRTGTLRRSETTQMEAKGTRGFIGTNVKYGPFVHEGTRYMEPQPFFEQGIEDSLAKIDQLTQKYGDQFWIKVIS